MTGIEHANGHRPDGLLEALNPGMMDVPRPDPDKLSFDLDAAVSSVVGLRAHAPEDAFSSSYLGTERQGSAVMIDAEEGLLITIGYLISEVESITLSAVGGTTAQAHAIAYDFPTGFGLIRSSSDLGVGALEFGNSADVRESDTAIVAPAGGRGAAIEALVVSKREFAGYWEYLLDYAIFTSPPHPHWSGGALLDSDGKLTGIGSLYVQDAAPGGDALPGNMFVPIDFLKPILEDMRTLGQARRSPRPWLGMYTVEAKGRVFITSLTPNGPAEKAGIEPGDVILGIGDRSVATLAECYRRIWEAGESGVNVEVHIERDEDSMTFVVESTDRYSFMKQPRRH